MRVEVLVLVRQDGLTHNQRHLVVRHHPPVLPGELGHDLSPGVEDLARRWGLKKDERSAIGKVTAVEVHVLDEGGRWQQDRCHDDRAGNAHGPVRPGAAQAATGGRAASPDPPRESTELIERTATRS
jgi:hypothetical protein